MENQSNQATKKGIILLLGIIIGLLVGVLVAFIVESKIKPKAPPVVNVVAPESQGGKDTVYKYIVHQYQPGPADSQNPLPVDSLATDSLYVEDGSMDLMLQDEDDQPYKEVETATVTSERMISRQEAPVLYFDANRNAITAPENALKVMEVQFWSTPIHNKMTYQFKDNVLKIKGLKLDNVYVIHYKDHYYLQSDKRIYQILPTATYQRLTEIRDVPFL